MKNLRIYIDQDKHEHYEKLVRKGNDNADYYPFQTFKDVFMLAACLGAKHGVSEPIAASRDIFNSDVFDEKTDIPVMMALAYQEDKSLATLSNERRVLDIVQEYANGGIAYLVEEAVNKPGKPLNNLVELVVSVN